ncbi:zinc ribbon domain-containing protein [Chondromyces crocatus]|uniref:zinc ribbon domain-containing protein n=1 Tax=Chondromyces crocatus TaxID=52 RepID=UPI00067C7586|nr:zinc ribbon domain-containing protein [Chondromyces crocatus]
MTTSTRLSSFFAREHARCPTCLEPIPHGADPCPECGEPRGLPNSSAGRPSIADDPPDASWLTMHWRPLVTLGAVATLIFAGVLLRYLAPHRFAPNRATTAHAPVPTTCPSPCWGGEACQLGRCVWQRPNDIGHLTAVPSISGPFSLPKDASDTLLLDDERFAVALLTGTQIRSARTGEVLSLISEAFHSRRLYQVGDMVYATSPQRIYVLHAASPRVLKTIEMGSLVGDLLVGSTGRRVLASLPHLHAVAILATEYHAEIDRIQFGDDTVGPLAVDDSGSRAITITIQNTPPGGREAVGGAAYAFDPGRLGWDQDRVRASLLGNPVSVLMTPDGDLSLVALRAANALAPLRWQPSGAVRQEADRIATCREPEHLELIRSERRAIIRCNEGRAIQILDLTQLSILQNIDLHGRATDVAVSPDNAQAVIAVNSEGAGSLALIDLRTYAVSTVPLSAEPTRVRFSPDGRAVIALSERSKVAWVIR